jgi:hypothetical protein
MHASILLYVAVGTLVFGLVGAIVFARRRPSKDLGSVSTSWTTEHHATHRGGDGASS